MDRLIFFAAILLCSLSSISQTPTAQFTVNTTEACVGDSINFTDQSVPDVSPIVDLFWDFGDGNSATGTNVSHAYTAAGIYTVILVAVSESGQADAEVKLNYIVVNPLPDVGFDISENGCTVPFEVLIANTSDAGLNYDWDFGNGQSSTLFSPDAITYIDTGSYVITLTVSNPITGCSASDSQAVVISNFTADFSAPLTGCIGSPIQFTDGSTSLANSWAWDFGDGQSSNTSNPTHSYASSGTYSVTLTTQDTDLGCSDSISYDINIFDTSTPSFTVDVTTGCSPLTVNFTNTSGTGSSFEWDFGDGNTFSGEIPPPHTYTEGDSYSVSLTMTDLNGCVSVIQETDLITSISPDVQFSSDVYNGCAPLTVQFSESSVSSDPSDPIISWEWDYGDGTTSSGQVPPPHTYEVGRYDVTLTVTTQDGCQGSLTIPEMVEVGALTVDFSVNPTIECAKTDIFFLDETSFGGTPEPEEVQYFWNFGDGGMSDEENPTYIYPSDTGFFDVTLIVDWRGCIDTFSMNDAVYIKAPISIFTPDQSLFCNPTSLPVTINVTDDAIHGESSDDIEMVWKWGDGTQYFLDDPQLDDANKGDTAHTYSAYGTYVIEQVIYNHTTGCEDSTTVTINVSETTADFSLSEDSICVGNPVILNSASTSTHPFGVFSYNMGNGGNTSGSPASYTYSSGGTFDIQLIATNSVGCADTAVFNNFTALSLPDADILPPSSAGCASLTVTYTNNSAVTGNGVPLESFNWIYPDQTTQTTNDIATQTSYTFNSEGSYTTTMIAIDAFGCASPPASSVTTITKPSASFLLDTVICNQADFTAQNISNGGVSYDWYVDGNSVSTNTDFSGSFNETEDQNTSVSHLLTLIATDLNGCRDTVEKTIIVSLPNASVNYNLTGTNINADGNYTCPPIIVIFSDNSESYGSIIQWDWDFGDGKFSSLQDPDNTYVFPGSYTASLAITDEFGCTSDTSLIDFLTISGPSGNPIWTSSLDDCNQSYLFEIEDMLNVSSVIWHLGDGNTSEEIASFTYSYSDLGEYNPTVTLIDSNDCAILYELPAITVPYNIPDAFFTSSTVQGEVGEMIHFYDQSSAMGGSPITQWIWTANGGTFVAGGPDDFEQAFGVAGAYEVTLTVINADGCMDSYPVIISIINGNVIIPSAFTPDGDGAHDYWEIYNLTLSYPNHVVHIYNRWGNQIYKSPQGGYDTQKWDGTYNGNLLPVGSYYYIIEYNDEEKGSAKGTVSIIHNK